jgi:hypothetical protein
MTITLALPAGPRALRLPFPFRLLLLAIALAGLSGCESTSASAPRIDRQPSNQTAFLTQTATFAVAVEGAFPLRFQWRKDGVDIPRATGITYVTPPVTLDDDGARYSVVISNDKGTVTSADATLTVRPGPAITTQPVGQSVNVGATATFSVQASGDSLRYQWRRNDQDIGGATSATYTTPATTVADDGAVYTVAVGNPGGFVISDPATLVVSGQPAFSLSPVNQVIAAGRPAIFSSLAGGGSLAYQWRRGSQPISGETARIYTLVGTELADDGAQFSVTASNAIGSATSAVATLTVLDRPADPPPALIAEVAASRGDTTGDSFTVVRKSDGSVWQWGYNGEGQRGDGTSQAVNETPGPSTLPAGRTAVRIAAGARHVVALLDDGSVHAWGLNNIGQLGQGDILPRFTPAKVELPASAVAIAAGRGHSLAVLADGRVFAWGDNGLGQLGDGSVLTFVTTPQAVAGIADAVDVAAGAVHSLALLADGRVLAWGSNISGQLGDGTCCARAVPWIPAPAPLRASAPAATSRSPSRKSASCWPGARTPPGSWVSAPTSPPTSRPRRASPRTSWTPRGRHLPAGRDRRRPRTGDRRERCGPAGRRHHHGEERVDPGNGRLGSSHRVGGRPLLSRSRSPMTGGSSPGVTTRRNSSATARCLRPARRRRRRFRTLTRSPEPTPRR